MFCGGDGVFLLKCGVGVVGVCFHTFCLSNITVVSLSLFPFLFLSLSVCLALYISIYMTISVYIYISISLLSLFIMGLFACVSFEQCRRKGKRKKTRVWGRMRGLSGGRIYSNVFKDETTH